MTGHDITRALRRIRNPQPAGLRTNDAKDLYTVEPAIRAAASARQHVTKGAVGSVPWAGRARRFETITRRTVCTAAAVAAVSRLTTVRAAQSPSEQGDFLFVQSAKGMTFDRSASTLTLDGVSPITLFFSDRPERIAGNMRTAAFIPFWSKGKNSFLADPPNADVSLLGSNRLQQVVVVLRDPALQGDSLTYTVRVLKGEMPTQGADVSVFIDIIGVPLTPVSYAGVARRTYRRAAIY